MSKKQFEEEYWKHHSQKLEARHMLAHAFLGKPESILDLGCGDGMFLNHVNASRKVGLELSEEAASAAQKKGLDVRVFDFEVQALPFQDNEFEFVTLLDVLEHTFEPRTHLRNAARVGKRVVITVPNFAFCVSRFQALLGKVPTVLSERKGHIFYFTRKKVHQVFSDAHVRILDEKYYFPLMNVPVLGFLSKFVGSFFPGFFATEFAVVGEKK